MKNRILLSRDDFRNSVFQRDGYDCVVCSKPAVDAHHIIERRLFSDGGYYLDNGASVCAECHIKAEKTLITCEQLREAAGITETVLPEQLYSDQRYDKWGNPYVSDRTEVRLKGDLFQDVSVQKILKDVIDAGLFESRVKYPRTYHLPWSPGVGKDDRIMKDFSVLENQEIVITEKKDGENTTMMREHIHARSIDYTPHASRNWVKTIHARICGDIPEGWRVCGENLYAEHSIHYDNLEDYFLMFSIWNDRNECLSWDETIEWSGLLGLKTVNVLARGKCDDLRAYCSGVEKHLDFNKQEGYVVRTANSFHYSEFRTHVGKFVRENHVQTHGHWMSRRVIPNTLRKDSSDARLS